MTSALKINLHKNKLIGVGVPLSQVSSVVDMIGCTIFELPFIHLGVPVGQNMSCISTWYLVFDWFQRRLSGRKAKCLSFSDPLTMVKSVLGSLNC